MTWFQSHLNLKLKHKWFFFVTNHFLSLFFESDLKTSLIYRQSKQKQKNCSQGLLAHFFEQPSPNTKAHSKYQFLFNLINDKNSSRVFGSSRKTPIMVLVTVLLLLFCTPRIIMHRCLLKGRDREKVSKILFNK